ncbi:MAG: hypothetical protein U0521_18330 [Anaerolineae bacterium]
MSAFETLNPESLLEQRKHQNLNRDYSAAINHARPGVGMASSRFCFRWITTDETVFDRTVAWAIDQGIETATFRPSSRLIPDTALFKRMEAERASPPTTGICTIRGIPSTSQRS